MKENEITIETGLKMLESFAKRMRCGGFAGEGEREIINLKDGYISFNSDTDTGAETALVKNGKFFILLGDHRKSLRKCKTYTDAAKVFKKLIKNGAEVSMWSNYK